MEKTSFHQVASVILAAGQGKRMNLAEANKVTLPLAEKPIIVHIVGFMREIGIETVVVVVGYAKESVMEALQEESVLFAEQKEQLGTGHAAACALEVLPAHITEVCIVYGDDAVLYTDENRALIAEL